LLNERSYKLKGEGALWSQYNIMKMSRHGTRSFSRAIQAPFARGGPRGSDVNDVATAIVPSAKWNPTWDRRSSRKTSRAFRSPDFK